MKIFAVIDTNIIVSALISRHTDSATVMVLNGVFSEHIIPVYNEDILNEYATVLRRKKFNFSEDFINETITTIKDNGQRLKIRCSRYPSSVFLLHFSQEICKFRYMFLRHVGKGTLKGLCGQVHNGSF